MSYYELPVWGQFLLTCGDDLLGVLTLFIYLYPLFEGIPVRRLLKKSPFLLLAAPAVAAFNWTAMSVIQNFWLLYLIFALFVSLVTLWSMWVWRCSFWESLFAVCVAGMLQSSTSLIIGHLLGAALPVAELEAAYPGVSLLFHLLFLPVHLVISMMLRRLRFGERFRAFLEGKDRIRRTALLFAALESVFVALHYMQYSVQPQYLAEYLLIIMTLILLAVALVFHLAQLDIDRRQMQAQQGMIAWQQLYEQSLEELRQEMRTFRHDYKNLLAGFAGGMEGEGLRRSLKELEAGFDRRLGEKMNVSAQIGNLRIPQMRSLMLGKMAAMAEQGIECRLETLYPVERVGMDVWDFVRCLGILLDNAMEAALETEAPWVEVVFLQEGNVLMLRVSNPCAEAIDCAGFWEEGWSTKGHGRGLGLYSYQKILRAYPDAFSAASWKDGIFVQELTVGGRL